MSPAIDLKLVVLPAVLLYPGLAILGWGGFAPFFAQPPLIALTIATFLLTAAAFLAAGNRSSGERDDRGNRIVAGR
ncbi:MAG TPA: hypothetical protein VM639_03105 [Dongiaceae bacterium]|nr:hypothetical protein [Dongiaceae bacterium]